MIIFLISRIAQLLHTQVRIFSLNMPAIIISVARIWISPDTLTKKSDDPENCKQLPLQLERSQTNVNVREVYWEHFASCFLFTVSCFNWSLKKNCVAKILLGVWEIFSYKNNCNHNSYKLCKKFAFIRWFSFLENQKQESNQWPGNEKYLNFCL